MKRKKRSISDKEQAGKLAQAEKERDEWKAAASGRTVSCVCATRPSPSEEALRLREALKQAGHWFNEQMRLYGDASQSLVARNFQIENFAKAGFDACLAALSSSAPVSEGKS